MPEYRIVETAVSDKAELLAPLIEMHRSELVTHEPLMRAEPNWQAYRALENTRALLALAAYRGDEIVGYATAFIGQHLHCTHLCYALCDALYLKPVHRKGRLGVWLLQEMERLARSRGAALMMCHALPDTRLSRLLPRLGYGMEEIVFSKEI